LDGVVVDPTLGGGGLGGGAGTSDGTGFAGGLGFVTIVYEI
jgi:hypothetical protein